MRAETVDPLVCVATHEAGHFLVGLALGVPVEGIEVQVEDGRISGCCHQGDVSLVECGALAIYLLAGLAAERQLGVEVGLDADRASDRRLARALLNEVGAPRWRVRAALQQTEVRAALLVKQHWHDLRAVARHLAARKSLTRDQVFQLLNGGSHERS